MSIGYFLDKTHQPSPQELEETLGSTYPLWKRLLQFIEDNYQMPGEWSFGGKNYGWNIWYRKSGKSLVSLFPHQNSFVAQVVLGRDQLEKALQLDLGEKVGKMVRETPMLHDGKWLFIPVATATDASDIERLFLIKKKPVRRAAG